MSSVPSKIRILICSAGNTGKTALIRKSDHSTS
jgi:GTPase SAR1 family protein